MGAVLITRPEPGASATAALLAARGLRSIIAPFLVIEPLAVRPFSHVAACLITSANAVPAIPPHVTVFAVGNATAARAREITTAPVHSADGDAKSLAALLIQHCRPQDGPLLLLSGASQGLPLAAALRAAGFRVIRRIAYRAATPSTFPPAAAAAIAAGKITTALFYSPETARNFVRLLPPALIPGLSHIRALSLSPAIGAALATLAWREKISANHPSQESLLELL
jgi:uroporphyrinogen-III synthase